MEKQMKVTARSGGTFMVDTDEAKCLQFGFRHGDRVVNPNGDKLTIMGVAPVDVGKSGHAVLWYKLDSDNGSVSMWDGHGPRGLNLRDEGFRLLSEVEAEAEKTK